MGSTGPESRGRGARVRAAFRVERHYTRGAEEREDRRTHGSTPGKDEELGGDGEAADGNSIFQLHPDRGQFADQNEGGDRP